LAKHVKKTPKRIGVQNDMLDMVVFTEEGENVTVVDNQKVQARRPIYVVGSAEDIDAFAALEQYEFGPGVKYAMAVQGPDFREMIDLMRAQLVEQKIANLFLRDLDNGQKYTIRDIE